MPMRPRRLLVLAAFVAAFGVGDACAQSGAEQEFRDGLSAFNAGDYPKALRLWRPMAESGEARAQAGLGFMYHRGLGVAVDDVLAAEWLTRAARRGQADAQLTLGTLYFYGSGVPWDMIRAYAWCDLATSNGAEDAAMCREAALQSMASDAEMRSAFELGQELRNQPTRR